MRGLRAWSVSASASRSVSWKKSNRFGRRSRGCMRCAFLLFLPGWGFGGPFSRETHTAAILAGSSSSSSLLAETNARSLARPAPRLGLATLTIHHSSCSLPPDRIILRHHTHSHKYSLISTSHTCSTLSLLRPLPTSGRLPRPHTIRAATARLVITILTT